LLGCIIKTVDMDSCGQRGVKEWKQTWLWQWESLGSETRMNDWRAVIQEVKNQILYHYQQKIYGWLNMRPMQISPCKRVPWKEQSSWNISKYYTGLVGQDCAVSIATPYGLDGLGIKSWWGWDFPHPSRLALGPTQPPIQWALSFVEVKQPGHGVDHPPPSSAKVKERVELYIYSPFGPCGMLEGELYLFIVLEFWNKAMLKQYDCLSNLLENKSRWQSMSVDAAYSIRTLPEPTIFTLLYSFKEEFTYLKSTER